MNEEIKEQAEVPQENQAPAAEGAASSVPEAEPQAEECCRGQGGDCEQKEGCKHGGESGHEHEKHCRREKMKEELEAAKAEAAAFKDKWMRTAAEFDNFRKRNEQTRRSAYLDGKADVIVKVLPVGDNLERALATCDEQTKKGIEMVLRSFKKLLDEEGIEEIDPKDEEFDPAFCEAIMSEPAADGAEPGYVKEVFLKGYKRGDKVIRFAQVKVTT